MVGKLVKILLSKIVIFGIFFKEFLESIYKFGRIPNNLDKNVVGL